MKNLLAGLSSCTTVEITPTNVNLLTVQNPLNAIPKIVHVTCGTSSNARTTLGWIMDAWYIPEYGATIATFTGGTSGTNKSLPVQATPTTYCQFHLTNSVFESYRGEGTTGQKWDTNTQYTVEFYS